MISIETNPKEHIKEMLESQIKITNDLRSDNVISKSEANYFINMNLEALAYFNSLILLEAQTKESEFINK